MTAVLSEPSHIVASKIYLHETCSCVSGRIGDAEVTFKVGTPGAHHVSNSLAVLGAVQAAGADLALAALSLAEVEALSGRGRRHVLDVAGGSCVLIDESYNANPASMSAAIKALGLVPRLGQGRRIAVLGDMAELGEASKDLHTDIAGLMDTVDIDLVFSCGRKWRICLPICHPTQGHARPFNRCADKYSSGGNSCRRCRYGQRLACQPDEPGCRCTSRQTSRARVNKGATRCCMN